MVSIMNLLRDDCLFMALFRDKMSMVFSSRVIRFRDPCFGNPPQIQRATLLFSAA